jgi:glycerate 2-kinase
MLPRVVAAHSGDRPVIAVVGRCDVPAEQYGSLGLTDVHSISEIAGRDTARDPVVTTEILQLVGARIGVQLAGPRAGRVALATEPA